MSWKAYHLKQIDNRWQFLQTVQDVAGQIARSMASERVKGNPPYWHGESLQDFWQNFDKAKALARDAGWKGDYMDASSEPKVLWLPDPNDATFKYAFVWKQSQNGSTFVVSQIALPWLT
jgi:hypothetical protein